MPLKSNQVHHNAPVDIDGKGTVVTSGEGITSVSRSDGKVDWYTTEYLLEEATVPEQKQADDSGPTTPAVDKDKPTDTTKSTARKSQCGM